jgi:hypothetical protein
VNEKLTGVDDFDGSLWSFSGTVGRVSGLVSVELIRPSFRGFATVCDWFHGKARYGRSRMFDRDGDGSPTCRGRVLLQPQG